jgi:hypothetical protein
MSRLAAGDFRHARQIHAEPLEIRRRNSECHSLSPIWQPAAEGAGFDCRRLIRGSERGCRSRCFGPMQKMVAAAGGLRSPPFSRRRRRPWPPSRTTSAIHARTAPRPPSALTQLSTLCTTRSLPCPCYPVFRSKNIHPRSAAHPPPRYIQHGPILCT